MSKVKKVILVVLAFLILPCVILAKTKYHNFSEKQFKIKYDTKLWKKSESSVYLKLKYKSEPKKVKVQIKKVSLDQKGRKNLKKQNVTKFANQYKKKVKTQFSSLRPVYQSASTYKIKSKNYKIVLLKYNLYPGELDVYYITNKTNYYQFVTICKKTDCFTKNSYFKKILQSFRILQNTQKQATPTFIIASGAIAFGTTVTIISAGADAIYYTTDGSDPTILSVNQALTPLVINAAGTIKAVAVKDGYDNSDIGSAVYTQAVSVDLSGLALSGSPEGYTFASGTYIYNGLTVLNAIDNIIVTPTGSGIITVEGVEVNSGEVSDLIALTAGVEKTITVIATETGKSPKTYTIEITRNAGIQTTPTFDPVAGVIAFGNTVTIISAGADAIYYTTDGSDPTIASTNQAITPLVINAAVTAKALAVRAGYDNSAIGSAVYTALTIGANYQGGKVAYILQSVDPGYDANLEHGLIAAVADQSSSAGWGCYETSIAGADGTAIGTGSQNTTDIVAGCPILGIAAEIAYNLEEGGYNDWYLPSKDELNQLYNNRVAIGGFVGIQYWCSSEVDANYAWNQFFDNGDQISIYKSYTNNVRAIRAF